MAPVHLQAARSAHDHGGLISLMSSSLTSTTAAESSIAGAVRLRGTGGFGLPQRVVGGKDEETARAAKRMPFSMPVARVIRVVRINEGHHQLVTSARELTPIAPIPPPVTVVHTNIARAVRRHATAELHGIRDWVSPIPPPLAPATVALGDLAGPVQLRSTEKLRHPRQVVNEVSHHVDGGSLADDVGHDATRNTIPIIVTDMAVHNVHARPGLAAADAIR